jgi:hypothetical protein
MPELPSETVEKCSTAAFAAYVAGIGQPEDKHDAWREIAERVLQAAHVPELLEALRECIHALETVRTYHAWTSADAGTIKRARAALEKVGVMK